MSNNPFKEGFRLGAMTACVLVIGMRDPFVDSSTFSGYTIWFLLVLIANITLAGITLVLMLGRSDRDARFLTAVFILALSLFFLRHAIVSWQRWAANGSTFHIIAAFGGAFLFIIGLLGALHSIRKREKLDHPETSTGGNPRILTDGPSDDQ